MEESFKLVLVLMYYLQAVGGFCVAVYFVILNKKGNGLARVMALLFGSMAVMFGSVGVIIAFDLAHYWIRCLVMVPFFFCEYKFIKYIFNQLK